MTGRWFSQPTHHRTTPGLPDDPDEPGHLDQRMSGAPVPRSAWPHGHCAPVRWSTVITFAPPTDVLLDRGVATAVEDPVGASTAFNSACGCGLRNGPPASRVSITVTVPFALPLVRAVSCGQL